MTRTTRVGKQRVAATAAQRRDQALRLRLAGASYQEIADKVGYANKSSAYRAVSTEIQNIPREAADELRAVETERLDSLIRAGMPKALKGDVSAINAVRQIVADKLKFLGIANTVDAETRTVQALLVNLADEVTAAVQEPDAVDETSAEPRD